MSNNINVTVTMQDFEAEQDIHRKLALIYRAVSAQQVHCEETVKLFTQQINDLSAPDPGKLNMTKISGLALGSGGVGALIVNIPEIIKAIGNWFHR
jgi:hypothetical protein